MWASRAIIFIWFVFRPDSQPLPSFHVGFAGNSEFVCLFIFIFKTPFYFCSAYSSFSCCTSLFALLFYSFAYLPLDYTGSPAGASLFCLLYLILFAFSLPIFYYKSCLFIIALNLFLDFIIDVLSLLGLSFDCPFFFFRPYNGVLKLSKVPKAPQSSHWYREFHIMVAEELRTSTSTKRFVTPKN